MRLIILHYHLRPGGVRRVIELTAPHLLRADKPENGFPPCASCLRVRNLRIRDKKFSAVVLAAGEPPDEKWLRSFRRSVSPVRVELLIVPAFSYFSEQRGSATDRIRAVRAGVDLLLAEPGNSLVWAHNPGLGRNLPLTREIVRRCRSARIPLVLHHHDWWFDNRWQRWPEIRRCGFRTPGAVARSIFPAADTIRHVTINRDDAAILQKHFRGRVRWLPNPVEPARPPARKRLARRWLSEQLGNDSPVWILPCRVLRRKNIAEALLLTRWLRPEAWLVTTGGVSSADEKGYAGKLLAAAQTNGWPLRLGILDGGAGPAVPELLAVSEAVLLTSLQEGFGLPNLEAAAAARPLIARRLPNVAPDLAGFGFRFPQSYDEILVAPELFDWRNEEQRQEKLFRTWRQRLPRSCRAWAGEPFLLAHPSQPVPFSRLSLTAQLEVLGRPTSESWSLCAPINPFLRTWKKRASAGTLRVTAWPRGAEKWLGGPAYAERFGEIFLPPGHGRAADARAAQEDFLRDRLKSASLFPLLWAPVT